MSRTLWRISTVAFLAAIFLHLQTNSALAFDNSNTAYQIKPQNAAAQQNFAAPNKPMTSPANSPAWYNKTQSFFRNDTDTPTATSYAPPAAPFAPVKVTESPVAPIPGFAGPKFSDPATLPRVNSAQGWVGAAPAPANSALRDFSAMPLTPPADFSAAAQSAPRPQAQAPAPAATQDYYTVPKQAYRAPTEQPLRAPTQPAGMNSTYPNLSSVPMQPVQDQSSSEWTRKLQAEHAQAQQVMQQNWAQSSNEYFQEFPVVPQQAAAPVEMPPSAAWAQTHEDAAPSQLMATPVTQQNADTYRSARSAQPARAMEPARATQASNPPSLNNTADTQNWPKTPVYVMQGGNNFDEPLVPPSTPYQAQTSQSPASNELAWADAPMAAPNASIQQAPSNQPSIISYGNVYVTTGDAYQRNGSAPVVEPSVSAQAWAPPATAVNTNSAASMTPATPFLNPRDLSIMMPAEGTPAPTNLGPQSWGNDPYGNNAMYGMPLQPPSNAFAQQPIAASPFAQQPTVTNLAELAPMNAPAPFVAPNFTPMPQGNYYTWSDMTGQNGMGGMVPPVEITGGTPWSYNGGAMQAYTDRMMQSAPYTSGTGAAYYPYGYSGFGNWQGARSPYRTQVASNSANVPTGTGQYPTPIGSFDTNKPVATLYFRGDNATLGAEETKVLKQLTDWFHGKGGGLKVVGHSSARTADMDPDQQKKRNYKLSLDRADNVAKRLQKLGVPSDRIIVSAHGDTEKAYSESMPSGEAWNRRVEVYWDMF